VQHADEYGRLVVGCLQSSGILCLGLYRMLGNQRLHADPISRRQKRYVITNPPSSFQLLPTDKVAYTGFSTIRVRQHDNAAPSALLITNCCSAGRRVQWAKFVTGGGDIWRVHSKSRGLSTALVVVCANWWLHDPQCLARAPPIWPI